jgi:hypothetical protein
MFFTFYNPSKFDFYGYHATSCQTNLVSLDETALFNCFLNQFPAGCDDNPKILCSRGEAADYGMGSIFGFVLLGNMVIAVFIGLLIVSVYRQEKKSDKYILKGQTPNRKNTRNTTRQGMRYTFAYFLAYFTLYVILAYDLIGSHGANMTLAGKYTLEYFYVILSPLMGAFNCAVYFYPRWKSKRQQNPESSAMTCLFQVLGFDCFVSRGKSVTIEITATPPPSNPEVVMSGSLSEEEKEEERPYEKDVE